MPQLFLASLLLLASAYTTAADSGEFPGVKGLMSAQEYEDAGIDKLSEEEREALDQWLIRYTAWQAPQIRKSVEEVKEVEKDFELNASIKQPFKGWSDSTYFYLDNGQVWQQRLGGKYRSRKLVDPEVIVERGRFGYYLRLAEGGRSIGVRRLR